MIRTATAPATESAPAAAVADPITIDFEDIALDLYQFIPMPDDYLGFDWKNFGAYTPSPATSGSGYVTGISSGEQAAYALGAADTVLRLPQGRFTLESVDLTAAWNTSMTVDIYGYRGGQVVEHATVQVTDAGPLTVALGFENIRKVVFVASNGIDDPALDGQGNHIVFDDIVVSDLTQRPTPLAAAFGPDRNDATAALAAAGFAPHHPMAPLDGLVGVMLA